MARAQLTRCWWTGTELAVVRRVARRPNHGQRWVAFCSPPCPPEWVTLLAAGADASTAPIAENILRALASIGSHRPVLAMSGEWFVERGELGLRTGQRGQQGLPLIEMDSDLPERPQSASPAPNRAWRGPKLRALRSSRDFEEYRSFYEERELQHNHPSQYAGGRLPELVHPRATRHLRVIR